MDRARVRIVEVQNVRADAVNERSMQGIETFGPPENGSLRRACERTHGGKRALDGLVSCTADRTPQPVEERACRLVAHGVG